MEVQELKTTIREGLNAAVSYPEYLEEVEGFVKEKRTSGKNQHEDLVYFTKLNAQRSRRLNKTISLTENIQETVNKIPGKQTWLVLSESWCGDAAQILPLINKLSEGSGKIDLRIIYRDEHLELMDEFLTNGGRSIPKLIILDEEENVLGTWGPRPSGAQELYNTWKNDPNKPPYREFQAEMQKWYFVDKGHSTFQELQVLLTAIAQQKNDSSLV